MILDRLFQRAGIQLLKRSLGAASLRQETIASNIANVTTPGYQRKEVQFQEKLKESMQESHIAGVRTDSRHIQIGSTKTAEINPQVEVDTSEDAASGINNVDVDKEMADLAKNQIYFSATATLVARKFRGLKAAIRGRSFG